MICFQRKTIMTVGGAAFKILLKNIFTGRLYSHLENAFILSP